MKPSLDKISLRSFSESDSEPVFQFLVQNSWAFHSGPVLSREKFDERIKSGYYTRADQKTLIIELENTMIGYVRVFDLGGDAESAETPLFDLRISESHRNQGWGSAVVKMLVSYVLEQYPNKKRMEATTRIDNIGMRKVLERSGFVKEAHYRASWPSQEGSIFDTVGYGILRRDWETGKVTKVQWEK